jgi:putative oxidoreductase
MDLKKPFDTIKDEFLDDAAFLILRLGLGFGMAFGHGWGKLMKLLNGEAIEFMSFLGVFSPKISFALVVFSELFCSIFLILGLFTRWAAFFLFFTMCVAVFYKHFGDPFGRAEKGFIYMVGYLAIFLAGAGNFSLDAKFERSH